MVRAERATQERAVVLDRTTHDLAGTLGRWPSELEIAERLGCSVEQLRNAREAASADRVVSFDKPLNSEGDGTWTMAESLGTEDPGYERVEDLTAIAAGFQKLGERDRRLLHLRFGEDLTQNEIARRVGYSQMHVSRLLRRAIDRLAVVV